MRFANENGRGALVISDELVDLESASGGRLPSDPMQLLARWSDVVAASSEIAATEATPMKSAQLGSPIPRPGAIFGLVANYPPATRPDPPVPMVFGKFPNSVCGPYDDIRIPAAESLPMQAEWTVLEAELAVVIGRGGRRIRAVNAFDHVAGFTVAQDITERVHEFGPRGTSVGSMEYVSLKTMGKSLDTYCPLGPFLVTIDEFATPENVRIECKLNGEIVQEGSTGELLFGVAELIEFLSTFATLSPGDVILTGTPTPIAGQLPRLAAGDVIETSIAGIGTLKNTCVADVT